MGAWAQAFDSAVVCFRSANDIQRHDVTFMQLGKVYELQEAWNLAIEARPQPWQLSHTHWLPRTWPHRQAPDDASPHAAAPLQVYIEALDFSPESSEVLTTIGELAHALRWCSLPSRRGERSSSVGRWQLTECVRRCHRACVQVCFT